MPSDSNEKLSLVDAVGMAIGGMVGGGIFAVLGEAAVVSGNAAFLSFGLAGVLALVSGVSYARLTSSFDEPGGSFSYLERMVGPRSAGTVSWFVILGYLFTIALYSFTFGRYTAELFGVSQDFGGWFGVGIIALVTAVNLGGVALSGKTEDALVYTKIVALIALVAVGAFAVRRSEALPVLESGSASVVTGAALLFVAFEGFQLVTYDYADIEDHKRNLTRTIWISIPVVILLYMAIAFVTTGALSDQRIEGSKETVLAHVVTPILGSWAVVAVVVLAMVSTSSAIHATLFATARLGDRVADDHQMPPVLTKWRVGGVGVPLLLGMAGVAAAVQFVGNLHQITAFASLVFLAVFAVVNALAALHGEYGGWAAVVPWAGAAGCVAAGCVLVWDLWTHEPVTLAVVAAVAGALGLVRGVFVLAHRGFRLRWLTEISSE